MTGLDGRAFEHVEQDARPSAVPPRRRHGLVQERLSRSAGGLGDPGVACPHPDVGEVGEEAVEALG